MKKYYTNELGIAPSEEICCADRLEAAIASLPDDSELILTRGRYLLKRRLRISSKKNFRISGEGALLVVHFCASDLSGLDGALGVYDSENITLENLRFDYDTPPNIAGRITHIDRDGGSFDIKIFDSFICRGDERFEALNSVDEEYTPDYKLVTYDDCKNEYLGGNLFRINAKDSKIPLDRLSDGQLVAVRHVKYGPPLISFTNVDGCILQDITVYAAAGIVYLVSPRCRSFSFIRCRLTLPCMSERILTSNADGMHIVGLTGELYMKDCYFENMGDDALNMHSIAGTVLDVDRTSNTFRCIYGRLSLKPENLLGDAWAIPGDILNIYDKESFSCISRVKVLSYSGNEISYEPIFGEPEQGNIVANTAYYAETHIDNCHVYNTRARAFLLQTENILVENCHIYGMSGCAMILSPRHKGVARGRPLQKRRYKKQSHRKMRICEDTLQHRSHRDKMLSRCRAHRFTGRSP